MASVLVPVTVLWLEAAVRHAFFFELRDLATNLNLFTLDDGFRTDLDLFLDRQILRNV